MRGRSAPHSGSGEEVPSVRLLQAGAKVTSLVGEVRWGSAMRCVGKLLLPALLPLLVAVELGGQEPELRQDSETPRLRAGLAVGMAQPLGEFRDYVRMGGGVHGFFRVQMGDEGRVALRVHAGVLTYGRETQRVCLSETVGCRIEVDLTTSNNILLLGVGPEVGVPVGRARLYATGSVGLGYFSTDSQVMGTVQNEPFASTRNFGDGGFAWTGGGGVEVPLGWIQRVPVALDFGVSYQGNGRRDYLTRGGITDLPDGSLEFDVKRSQADFLLWRLGVSVGVPTGEPGG